MNALLLTLGLSIPVDLPAVRSATLYEPAGPGPFPAVLLVEGWWTPGPWEAASAQRLRDAGYLVLLVMPDRGERPADREAMHARMTGAPSEATRAGLAAAGSWLLARKDVRGGRIAVVGARMGGRDALHAGDLPGIAALVSWYGMPPARPAGATPGLAFFGGRDMGPSAADAARFAEAARGTATVVHVYPEAQHGFADPHNTWGGYDEKAAADSWSRAMAFLAERLGG